MTDDLDPVGRMFAEGNAAFTDPPPTTDVGVPMLTFETLPEGPGPHSTIWNVPVGDGIEWGWATPDSRGGDWGWWARVVGLTEKEAFYALAAAEAAVCAMRSELPPMEVRRLPDEPRPPGAVHWKTRGEAVVYTLRSLAEELERPT